MMPILVKHDNVISGTKAKASHGSQWVLSANTINTIKYNKM